MATRKENTTAAEHIPATKIFRRIERLSPGI